MGPSMIAKKAKEELAALTGRGEGAVIGVSPSEGEWIVTVEVVERRGIPDTMDLLGEYEVRMSEAGDFLNFSRLGLRKRGDASR